MKESFEFSRNSYSKVLLISCCPVLLLSVPLLLIISAPAMVKPQTAKDSKQREKLASMIMDCQKTTHASLADLNAIREKRMPSSHEGQCMIECVFSATKIMKNGNYDKAGALQVNKFFLYYYYS